MSSNPLLTVASASGRRSRSDVKMIAISGCSIVLAILCVCSIVGITNRIFFWDKQQPVVKSNTTVIFRESPTQLHNDEYVQERTALTEADFVTAAKVSPWSYLESRDNQAKQATVTLNTILRPNLLGEQVDEIESDLPSEVENSPPQLFPKPAGFVKADIEPKPISRPNAAVIYLVKTKKCCLADSIQLLFENFNRRFRYPVKLFHESDITSEELVESLKPVLKEDEIELLYAHQIEFSMPPNMTLERFTQFRENAQEPLDKLKRFKIGYSHMIRFFFKEIFEREDIQQLDFFLRLDTDSFITSEVTYDIFQHMKDQNYKYGYMGTSFDSLKVTFGVSELLQNYMDSHKDVAERVTNNLHMWKNGTHLKGDYAKMTGVWPFRTSQPLIYNNFEIVNVPTFRSAGIQNFVDVVDSTNNIYWLRWGDAVLRFFQMIGFLNIEKDVYCFVKDFGYKHQNYKSLPTHLQDQPFYADFKIPSKRTIA